MFKERASFLKQIVPQVILLMFLISCSKKGSTGGGGTTPVIIPTPVYDAQVTILAAENNQTIQGFGCATVFAPPATTALTTEEFDRLFGSGTAR